MSHSPDLEPVSLAGNRELQDNQIQELWSEIQGENTVEEEEIKFPQQHLVISPATLYFCNLCEYVYERCYCEIQKKTFVYQYDKTIFWQFWPANHPDRIFYPITVCPVCVGELDGVEC